MDPRNHTQALARSGPSLEFGSYEEVNLENPRQLPFDLQQPILYKVCGTLEAAIFEFTKRWAPEFFDDKNVKSGREVELNFWEKWLAAAVIPVEAFEEPNDIPRYHNQSASVKRSVTLSFTERSHLSYKTRAESLDEIHQILHHVGSLLHNQVTVEMKEILEDRLQTNRRLQKTLIGWLEASRLQEEESEILRDLNHENDVFASLYARLL
ncbi:hypothetical protein BOTCAL_0108g00340 [Botryotinia calthae]|uniref:Uncharacterized protein n=1 Tax=Botryotinia calthae TaxID=38488 RepID=A0A4Y8D7Q2_9HELO|nr:hypothetical protein BOTCAL_0108g00340 [Botryotinia calthae]